MKRHPKTARRALAAYAAASNDHINRYKMAHMIGVAEYMREHAKEYGVVPDEAYVVGLLHDIGYLKGRIGHEAYGAVLLLDTLEVNSDIVWMIKHHGDNPYDLIKGADLHSFEEISKWRMFTLLLEADMSVSARGYKVGFDGRLKDITERYGEEHPAHKTCKEIVRFIREYKGQLRPCG